MQLAIAIHLAAVIPGLADELDLTGVFQVYLVQSLTQEIGIKGSLPSVRK